MTNEQSGVKKTQARAEQALRELMLSGSVSASMLWKNERGWQTAP